MGFEWVPGKGVCERRLTTLINDAPMPLQPMGEAWFIGENRRIFIELSSDLTDIPTFDLQNILAEIASGIGSFGRLDEWEEWLKYLMPRLTPRNDERYVSWLLEELCTAFIQNDLACEISPDVSVYRENVLYTLGCAIMDERKWHDGSIVLGKVLHPSNNYPAGLWGWRNVSGDLAASIIVCLRLIEKNDISGWVKSIFAIECPYWRAQVLTWYVGSKALLNGKIQFPSQFDDCTPEVSWSWSHCIDGMHGEERVANSVVPESKMTHFKAEFEAAMKSIDLNVWRTEIMEIDALHTELGSLIEAMSFS